MKIIIGNWKMNGTRTMFENMTKIISQTKTSNRVIVCPPYTLLYSENNGIPTGAQDISTHDNGAYTGEISGQMIAETGAKYVIVGHSERRLYHNETNEIIKQKTTMAIQNKLTPIICIGETLDERESNKTEKIITNMLENCIPNTEHEFMIAYEPRWAIGTGMTPTPNEIESVHNIIFEYLKKHNHETTSILYGGSVSPSNATAIAAIPHVDGLLIGGASLKPDTFIPIIESVK